MFENNVFVEISYTEIRFMIFPKVSNGATEFASDHVLSSFQKAEMNSLIF